MSMAENHVGGWATGRLVRLFRDAWRGHAVLVVFIVAYAGLAILLRHPDAPGISFDPDRLIEVFGVILPMFALAALVFLYIRLMIVSRGRSPLHTVRQWGASTPWVDIFLFRFPLAIAFLMANQLLYVSMKINIPFVVPFSWDATLAAWDRALLFGQDAWVLTHAVFSTPLASAIIDGLYITWFFAVYLGFLLFAALPMNSHLRLSFMLAFGLSWAVGGSVLATVFSSAGPVYMEALFDDATFAPLMTRLAEQSEVITLRALAVQDTLWQGYNDPNYAPVGISAFPSMHNCVMIVLVLGFFKLNRTAGIAMSLLALAVVIGSVHLGWHYLVDSLAGLVLGWLIWVVSGRIARWWLGPQPV